MQQFLMFTVLGICTLYYSLNAETILPIVGLADIAAGFFGAGLAFGLHKPGVLMKSRNGRLVLLGYLLFWPYLTINHLILSVYALFSQEPPMDEILPGVYVGRRIWNSEHEQLIQRNICAVLDATAEWGENRFIRTQCADLNVPVLDGTPPTVEQLQQAVTWIDSQRLRGGVLVHCAVGHGRSATIAAAYLLQTHVVASVQEAITFLQQKRPRVYLNSRQIAMLQDYMRETCAKRAFHQKISFLS